MEGQQLRQSELEAQAESGEKTMAQDGEKERKGCHGRKKPRRKQRRMKTNNPRKPLAQPTPEMRRKMKRFGAGLKDHRQFSNNVLLMRQIF
jgi:hypothetical protein